MHYQEGTIVLPLSAKTLGIEHIKELYRQDQDFGTVFLNVLEEIC